jgi:hypothetical protein
VKRSLLKVKEGVRWVGSGIGDCFALCYRQAGWRRKNEFVCCFGFGERFEDGEKVCLLEVSWWIWNEQSRRKLWEIER